MKKSKIFFMATLLIATLGLSACGGNKNTENPSTPAESPASTEETKSNDEPSGQATGLKIAIVSSPSGVDDGSFNQNNYEGIKKFIEKNSDSTVNTSQEPTGDPTASVKAVADIVADYDVIVCPGFQFAGISTLASENPEKKFILVDTNPEAIGEQKEFDNVLAMTFAEEESGFYAGVAAVLETKTNKVGFVGGIAFPSVVNYQFGFASGVNYANKVYGKTVQMVELPSYAGTDVRNENVGGNYVGNFNDESTGKVIGNALLSEGVDIIFVAAGNSGNGVFTAVKENGKAMVIGCDTDQYDFGANGDTNIVLTSVLKVMDLNVERALEEIKAGTFKGKNAIMKADTDSTGFVSTEGRNQLSKDTVDKLNEVVTKIKSGDIVPASNFSDSKPDNFKGL